MLTGSYSGHLIRPALAQSSFIFDEIHSYDNKLFERLIQFLENIKGVKVLLLTASLPKDRLSRLRKAVKKHIIDGAQDKINIIEGPEEWETILRYQRLVTDQDPVDLVIEKYKNGKKILWICNTVDRAMKMREEVIDRLKKTDCYDELSDCIIVYHSRFKYEDRINQHNACMNAFKNSLSTKIYG